MISVCTSRRESPRLTLSHGPGPGSGGQGGRVIRIAEFSRWGVTVDAQMREMLADPDA